jgi:MipA family protein
VIAGLASFPAGAEDKVEVQETQPREDGAREIVTGSTRIPNYNPDPDSRELPNGPPPFEKPVFDDTWATVGIGVGLVPSYSGSDDYRIFPLPLVVGRVAGVGISPNGPGFTLDFLSEGPSGGPPGGSQGGPPSGPPPQSKKPSFSFGPSVRFRNDRVNQIQDDVVELAEPLDTALEVGASAGVSFPGVFRKRDRVSLSAQASWDVLGAHSGMILSPSVGYFTPLSKAASLQFSASASIVDDDYADYYYSVTPAQSAATGLAPFTAEGGLESIGLTTIGTLDLDGNALNGGFGLYAIFGYSRLVGDAADTPFTSERGSASQLFGGVGVAYTF